MSESTVSPCAFPRCRDIDGNPRLTDQVICESCRFRYARLLDWIEEDFAAIYQAMPLPFVTASARRSRSTSFGHPRAWASDMLALIADTLNTAEARLRAHNDHGSAPDPDTTREPYRVKHSLVYLRSRFDDLCAFPDAEHWAAELVDLHRVLYSGLGKTRYAEALDAPCQKPGCPATKLYRETDRVYCRECGDTWPEEHWPRLALILAGEIRSGRDRALDEYAARHAERQSVNP